MSAAAELAVAYLPMSRSIASSFCHDRFQAEDIRQEAAVALIKAAARYTPEVGVSFPHFAACCIRNHLLNSSRSRPFISSAIDPRDVEDRRMDSNAEDVEALRAALGKLQPDVRIALELRFGETEATWDEIADACGVTVGKARCLVAAGLARLKSLME